MLLEAGVPNVLCDPHVLSELGTIRLPGVPMHFNATPAGVHSATPMLGEHTRGGARGDVRSVVRRGRMSN